MDNFEVGVQHPFFFWVTAPFLHHLEVRDAITLLGLWQHLISAVPSGNKVGLLTGVVAS